METVCQSKCSKEEAELIQIIPIEWHSLLHTTLSMESKFKSISLPSIPQIRVLLNEYLADILLYFSTPHQQVIRKYIVEKMNFYYDEFMKTHPDFEGRIGMIGHSLGGICCYDVLAATKSIEPGLKFPVHRFWSWGSPISATLIMREQSANNYAVPKDCIFQNMFHPCDPLVITREFELNRVGISF